MLGNNFNRHTIAFMAITLSSILLYTSARSGISFFSWFLLGLGISAAILTLTTK